METKRVFFEILYFFLFVSLLGLVVFVSVNLIGKRQSNSLGEEKQKIKIMVSEVAPAALSGKWKLIK
jgi:hypothetical protein